MNGSKCFIDTNIVLYAHTDQSPDKQEIAQSLITSFDTIVSTQVIQEMANTLYRKFKFDWNDIQLVVNEIILNNKFHTNTQSTILQACEVASRHGFSFYDSLIIAAALETGSEVLYSEDMQHQQVISGVLTIINPFL